MSLTLDPPRTTSSGGISGVGRATRAAIVGKARVGSLLRAKEPKWSATPSVVAYRWQLCAPHGCATIKHATKRTLKLLGAYAGRGVRVLVTATINGKTVTSTSATVHIAKPAPKKAGKR